jgi:hypothetical protein
MPSNVQEQAPRENRRGEQAKELTPLDLELALYGRAIELFNAGQFQPAKEAFEKLAAARNRDLAHSARLRIRMCEQRLALGR